MLDILDKNICDIVSIKKILHKYIDKKVIIKYDIGRNKIEIYNARIKQLYNCVFLVETDDELVKSFSYADVITKTIKIYTN